MRPGDAPPGDSDDNDAVALADVPTKHRAGRGDPAPSAGSPMFAAPTGAATGTDPAAGATASRPATVTMTDADTPAAPPPSPPPTGDLTAGLPVSRPGDAATPLTSTRLPAPAAAPAGHAGVTPRRQRPGPRHRGSPGVAPRCRVPSVRECGTKSRFATSIALRQRLLRAPRWRAEVTPRRLGQAPRHRGSPGVASPHRVLDALARSQGINLGLS